MKTETLEERVLTLERRVDELQKAVERNGRPKDWRRTVGMFSGDEIMKRIDEEALKYREADRAKARRRPSRSRRTK